MPDRLAVILASGDPRVLEMGLMSARNTCKQGWMEETKLFPFGPSETQVATDPTLREMIRTLIDEGIVPVACRFCSDKYSVSELLRELGRDVEYVGEPISQAIRGGSSRWFGKGGGRIGDDDTGRSARVCVLGRDGGGGLHGSR
jgi:hypothetical protein